jgi:outer membrane receptor for ferrienterochelin and colicins
LIWDVTPAFTTKLLYGSAFRAPNAYERDYVYPELNAANPNNLEEEVESYEVVGEWYAGKGFKLLGTLFYNNLRKVMQQDPNTLQFVSSGHYQTYGFELGAQKRWNNNRSFKLTWTHNYTRDEVFNGGSWATDSPKNLVKLHYAEPLLDDALRIGFEEIFVDQRRTLAGNTAPGYHLMNINLSTKPLYGLQAAFGVYNVLNQHYKVLGGPEQYPIDTLPMDGRTVRFTLEYGF